MLFRSACVAVLAAGCLSASAPAFAADGSLTKPEQPGLIAQKQPAPQPSPQPQEPVERFTSSDEYGGLVFADLEQLHLLLAEIGSVRRETDEQGVTYLAGTVEGINYVVDVYNCDPGCADLTFTASFEMQGMTNDLMNEWNASRRFGKAYIRSDGDAIIQMAINTRFGITTETFRDDLIWWQDVLTDYVEFIGFR